MEAFEFWWLVRVFFTVIMMIALTIIEFIGKIVEDLIDLHRAIRTLNDENEKELGLKYTVVLTFISGVLFPGISWYASGETGSPLHLFHGTTLALGLVAWHVVLAASLLPAVTPAEDHTRLREVRQRWATTVLLGGSIWGVISFSWWIAIH